MFTGIVEHPDGGLPSEVAALQCFILTHKHMEGITVGFNMLLKWKNIVLDMFVSNGRSKTRPVESIRISVIVKPFP